MWALFLATASVEPFGASASSEAVSASSEAVSVQEGGAASDQPYLRSVAQNFVAIPSLAAYMKELQAADPRSAFVACVAALDTVPEEPTPEMVRHAEQVITTQFPSSPLTSIEQARLFLSNYTKDVTLQNVSGMLSSAKNAVVDGLVNMDNVEVRNQVIAHIKKCAVTGSFADLFTDVSAEAIDQRKKRKAAGGFDIQALLEQLRARQQQRA